MHVYICVQRILPPWKYEQKNAPSLTPSTAFQTWHNATGAGKVSCFLAASAAVLPHHALQDLPSGSPYLNPKPC